MTQPTPDIGKYLKQIEEILLKRIKFIGEGEHTYLGYPQEFIDVLSQTLLQVRADRDKEIAAEVEKIAKNLPKYSYAREVLEVSVLQNILLQKSQLKEPEK